MFKNESPLYPLLLSLGQDDLSSTHLTLLMLLSSWRRIEGDGHTFFQKDPLEFSFNNITIKRFLLNRIWVSLRIIVTLTLLSSIVTLQTVLLQWSPWVWFPVKITLLMVSFGCFFYILCISKSNNHLLLNQKTISNCPQYSTIHIADNNNLFYIESKTSAKCSHCCLLKTHYSSFSRQSLLLVLWLTLYIE